jgi:hypothetical protein
MITYIIDRENKKVTAQFSGCMFDAIDKITKRLCYTPNSLGNLEIMDYTKYLMPAYFSATATCREPDIYDEEIGKQKAKAFLVKKYKIALNKRINTFQKELLNINNEIEKIKTKG